MEGHEHAVLLVDDQADSRDALVLLLQSQGFAVHVARDGQEGLEALQRGLRPCLVVVDLMMPRMDGWEFRQRQLMDPQFADIPVVVVSGYPNVDTVAAGLGVREVLRKPLSAAMLLGLVNLHCPRNATARVAE
jgi:two-component system response regulator MprA